MTIRFSKNPPQMYSTLRTYDQIYASRSSRVASIIFRVLLKNFIEVLKDYSTSRFFACSTHLMLSLLCIKRTNDYASTHTC